MSECLHCDINELVRKRIEDSEPADVDVALLAANVVESLVDLIIQVAPESEHASWQNVTAALIKASEGGEIREVNEAFRLASAMKTSAA